jgi:hypothetical protein
VHVGPAVGDGRLLGCRGLLGDFFEFDSGGLGEEEENKEKHDEAEEAIHGESAADAEEVNEGAEGEGDEEVDDAVGGGGGGNAATADGEGEKFGGDDPGDDAEEMAKQETKTMKQVKTTGPS